MSTRCNIIVKDENLKRIIYHHCDGYPEGVGKELKTILQDYVDNTKFGFYHKDYICDKILKYNDEYEESDRIAGDIDYLYELKVDPYNIDYTCYKIPPCEDYTLDNCKCIEQLSFTNLGNKWWEGKHVDEGSFNDTVCDPDVEENAINAINESEEILKYVNHRNMVIEELLKNIYKDTITKDELKNILKRIYDYATAEYAKNMINI